VAQTLIDYRQTAAALHNSQMDSCSTVNNSQSSTSIPEVNNSQSNSVVSTVKTSQRSSLSAAIARRDSLRNHSSAAFSDASWLQDVSLGTQDYQLPQQQQPELLQQQMPQQQQPELLQQSPTDRPFVYCYVDGSGQETGDQMEADIGFDVGVTHLIKCRKIGNRATIIFAFLCSK
jgi:hypothetical protein